MLNGKLFIHIPKNGGMSIRHGQSKFRERMSPQGLIWPRAPIMKKGYHEPFEAKMRQLGRPNVPYEHARWRDLTRDVQFAYDAFAIVRNPWSRVVSRYTFAVRNNNDWDSVTIKGKKTGGRNMTFDEFLDQRHQWFWKSHGLLLTEILFLNRLQPFLFDNNLGCWYWIHHGQFLIGF